MASTASSASAASLPPADSFRLLLRERADSGERGARVGETVLDLFSGTSDGLVIARGASVDDHASYDAILLCTERLGPVDVAIDVCGERQLVARHVEQAGSREFGGEAFHMAAITAISGPARLFDLAYGFADVLVRISPAREGGAARDGAVLHTLAVACRSVYSEHEEAASAMLSQMADAEGSNAMAWLRGRDGGTGRVAVPGAGADGVFGSTAGELDLADRIASEFSDMLPFFRTRALAAIGREPVMVGADAARSIGRPELEWCSRHPESLHRAPSGDVLPSRVRTSRRTWSRDVPENRFVLSFLSGVLSDVIATEDRLAATRGRFAEARELLSSASDDPSRLPSLSIVESCLRWEERLVARCRGCASRLSAVLASLKSALPDVGESRAEPPVSAAFVEVEQYHRAMSLHLLWESRRRTADPGRVLLARPFKMNAFYETYVLFGMLDWLDRAGFSPDAQGGPACSHVDTGAPEDLFSDDPEVNNFFRLSRGDERVVIWSQPVLWSGPSSANGVDVHRVTARPPFSDGGEGEDPYWIPDFLVRLEDGDSVRRFIVDAKFRKGSVVTTRPRKAGAAHVVSIFEDALLKYKCSCACDDGAPVDAVWLVCGRPEDGFAGGTFQFGGWAAFVGAPDGAVAFHPWRDGLGLMFRSMGIDGPEDGRTWRGSGAGANAVPPPEEVDAPEGLEHAGRGSEMPVERVSSDLPVQSAEETREGPEGRSGTPGPNARDGGRPSGAQAAPADGTVFVDGIGPGGGPMAVEGDLPEYASLVLRLASALGPDCTWLSRKGACHGAFGVNAAVLLASEPSGGEGPYLHVVYAGHDLYVYRKWRPYGLNRLRVAVAKRERRARKAK